jgi:uncharacterized membrane protein YwaF
MGEKKFFYDNFSNDQICGMFSFGHIFTVILFVGLLVVGAILLRKINEKQLKIYMLSVAIAVTVMEIIKISLRVAKNQAPDSYMPLYYCSLFIFAIWLSFAKNGILKTVAYSYMTMGAILAACFNIFYPSTSLALFPIWHPGAIHSFVYHYLMALTGILLLVKGTYVPKKIHSVHYFAYIFVACVISAIINPILGTNCMFLADAFGLPLLQGLCENQPVIYMLLAGIAQASFLYWGHFGIYKLIIYLKDRKANGDNI